MIKKKPAHNEWIQIHWYTHKNTQGTEKKNVSVLWENKRRVCNHTTASADTA